METQIAILNNVARKNSVGWQNGNYALYLWLLVMEIAA